MTDPGTDGDREALADLQGKAVRASDRVQEDKASSKSGDFDPLATITVITETVVCVVCFDEFESSGTKFGERKVLARTCADCLREETVVAVGSEFVLVRLREMGFNVRRHGRAELDDLPHKLAGTLANYSEQVRGLKPWEEIGSLYLMGPTGTGKTHAMAALARHLLEHGYPASRIVFVRARALITQIQDTYGSGGVDAVIARLRSAGILFVDDAGTEKVTRDAFRIVEDILDAREGHPTVWSSNDNPTELVDAWAEADIRTDRFRSRLAGFTFIPFEGTDRRFES